MGRVINGVTTVEDLKLVLRMSFINILIVLIELYIKIAISIPEKSSVASQKLG